MTAAPAADPALLRGPLAGWRVLELSDGLAASFCAKVLADLGAEVIMVEPPGGHALRSREPLRADGRSAAFDYVASGKRLRTSAADQLGALAADADLIVTDGAPHVVDGMRRAAPQAPVVSVRPFGATGPHAQRAAHHLTLFHRCGEGSTLPSGRSFELFPDRAPLQLGSEIGYFDAGWNAAVAALAACLDLVRSGTVQHVDVSVLESLVTLNRTRLNRLHNEGVCVGREKNRYGITGMLRCLDGWVQVVGLRDEHWERLVQDPDGAEFRAAGFESAQARAADEPGLGKILADWCAARGKHLVAATMSALGAPAGIFAEPHDLLASEQLAHRSFFREVDDAHGATVLLPGPPYRFSRTPTVSGPVPRPSASAGFASRDISPAATYLGHGRLLQGIRILDFTWAAAGPYSTLLLGLLGADVIKVESRRRLDPARNGFISRYQGLDNSPVFNELNLTKRSIELDLTTPEGLASAKQLAAEADVVVENFRPGVLARLGLAPDDLIRANPRLVVASSSANGATGPEALGAGLASIFAATGGLSAQTGYPDGPPTEVGDPVDYRSGTALTVAILAALLHRAQTGRGQYVDLSSREVVIASAPDALLAYAARIGWDERLGNQHLSMAPHEVYPCTDGWLAVAVGTDDERRGLRDAVGNDDVAAWALRHTAANAAEELQKVGVAAEPVHDFAAVAADEQLAARRAFVDVHHPVLGTQRVMRAPWLFSDDPLPDIPAAAPLFGADTEVIANL